MYLSMNAHLICPYPHLSQNTASQIILFIHHLCTSWFKHQIGHLHIHLIYFSFKQNTTLFFDSSILMFCLFLWYCSRKCVYILLLIILAWNMYASACKINLMQLLLIQLEANNTVVAFHILSRFGTNNSCTRPLYTFGYISIYV